MIADTNDNNLRNCRRHRTGDWGITETHRKGGKIGQKEKTGNREKDVAESCEFVCRPRQLPDRQNQLKDRVENYRSEEVRKER